MKLLIKSFSQKIFSFFGLKITRTEGGVLISKKDFTPYSFFPSDANRLKWIQDMNINTVIDVGAHRGEFAVQFHKLLPDAKIYCFEPLQNNFIELTSSLKNLQNIQVFNIALGDRQGETEMYYNKFSPSSSLMKIATLHKEIFPFTSKQELETIKINTLDDIAQELDLVDNILLKIDVQGYEDKVIKGAINLLEKIKILIIETSFCELYESQPLFAEIYELLSKRGFVYSGSWQELSSPIDGTPLQQDSLFIKR